MTKKICVGCGLVLETINDDEDAISYGICENCAKKELAARA